MKAKRLARGRPTGVVAGDWCYWPQDALERLGRPQWPATLVGDFCLYLYRGIPSQELFEALVIADERRARWLATTIRDELKRRDAHGELWT